MRIAWASDIHLDLARFDGFEALMNEIRSLAPDALLLTGDIATGDTLVKWINAMDEWLRLPIYFVLGNHDYYNSSIETVRKRVGDLTANSAQLHWVTAAGAVHLSAKVALVGHDGWADGRAGVGIANSPVRMRDHTAIEELAACEDGEELARVVAGLADDATRQIKAILDTLDDRVAHVVVATHVPPFLDACLYLGEPTDGDHLPHFSNPGLGAMLVDHADRNPHRAIKVLCGHTHDRAYATPHERITVHTAGAIYERPEIAGVVEVMDSTVDVTMMGE